MTEPEINTRLEEATAQVANLAAINARYSDVLDQIEMNWCPDDFLWAPDSLMKLMGWDEKEMQEAINDGRIALINWEGGGQSACTPNSVWLKK